MRSRSLPLLLAVLWLPALAAVAAENGAPAKEETSAPTQATPGATPEAATPAPQAPAPGTETVAPTPDTEHPEHAPTLHGTLALSLDDAIKMGLENNLDVQVSRYGPLIAEDDESIAWGAYDPNLVSELGYSDIKTPNASAILGSDPTIVDRTTDGFGGFQGILPLLSTQYDARFQGKRYSTNRGIQALVPEFDSGWSISLTQPVLKDLIWNQPWTQVKTTQLLLQSSREDFRRSVMDTVRAIEDAYWSLIANAEARKVAHKSLETAKALLDQTQTQYEVGVVSKVEVTEAEAGLSQREVNVIRAENQYRNQQDVLIDLVLGPGLRSNSTLEIQPTDQPEKYVPYQVDVPTAVERAFENRPEVVAAKKEIERQRVQLKFAKNQELPQLDGIFSYGQVGLSGDSNPDVIFGAPAPSQGGFGNTFDDYSDSPQFTARGQLSIPLPNTSARHNVSKTQLALRRAQTQQRRLEQSIILEVRRAARNLKASQEGIEAARDAQTAAEEQLRAEKIRLQYGESTPFDVLQREEQLVDRQNELIGAFQAYRTSVTALDRAQGTILRSRNIHIAEVSALR